MYSAKIANKLNELICNKASDAVNVFNELKYGLKCMFQRDFPIDGDIQIDILNYYKQFSEEQLIDFFKEKPCLKKIING